MHRIKILDLEHANQWVVSMDPDVSDTDPPTYPTGFLVTTSDPAEALLFPSFRQAANYWMKQSAAVPLRPDGQPNRPMTAYSVTIEPC